MTNKQKIERIENVLEKLIAWSARDLGVHACTLLLKELASDVPKSEPASKGDG